MAKPSNKANHSKGTSSKSAAEPIAEASSSQAPAPTHDDQDKTTRHVKKKKQKSAPEDVDKLQPSPKYYDASILQTMVKAAVEERQTNSKTGLFHVMAIEDSTIDGRLTAGYLNFHCVSDMREYCAKPGKDHPIRPLVECVRRAYSLNAFNKGTTLPFFYMANM